MRRNSSMTRPRHSTVSSKRWLTTTPNTAVAVGLDDLSGVTTATAALAAAGLIPTGGLPWTVSLHDLRIISELVERPAELLLYLRRRTTPEATLKYLAVDELDLFLFAFEEGLWVEPDPNVLASVPGYGATRVGDARRRKAQKTTLINSRTDPLDAWYQHGLGPGASPVAKPALTLGLSCWRWSIGYRNLKAGLAVHEHSLP